MRAGFGLGILVGALLGGGGVYLAIERPWGGGPEVAAPDAGVEQANVKKKKRQGKKRHGRRRAGEPAGEDIPELTDEQRRLVWKGAKVAVPSRKVDYGSGEPEGRTLSPAEINSVIKSGSRSVIDCIEQARGNALLKSAVTLELLVDEHGSVTKSRVRAPVYLFENGFERCARAAARELQFPATGAYTVVTAPYELY